MLKTILSSRNEDERKKVAVLEKISAEGILTRDTTTDLIEIIDDSDLQKILPDNADLPKFSQPAEVTLEPLRNYANYE